jgi:hypothetical protein
MGAPANGFEWLYALVPLILHEKGFWHWTTL